jgi:hypothetical protein
MEAENLMREAVAAGTYLGPARILARAGSKWKVALADRSATATLALAVPYQPQPGDLVLVIGTDELYVIGVIQGTGRSVLSVGGDLDIRAGGTLRLQGGTEVEIGSPRVEIRADRMETAIGTVFERVVDCYRWVKGLLQTSAGRSRTVVQESATLHAGRIVEKAKKDVSIDGDQIRLG